MLKNLSLPNRVTTYTWMITGALVLFEIFNVSTSYQTLMDWMGVVSWAAFVAFGCAAVDFGGLAKLVSPEMREAMEAKWLFTAWVLMAICNAGMTYYAVALDIAKRPVHILVTSGAISLWAWKHGIAIVVAIVTFAIHYGLVTRLGLSVDRQIDTHILPPPSSRKDFGISKKSKRQQAEDRWRNNQQQQAQRTVIPPRNVVDIENTLKQIWDEERENGGF